MATLVRSLAASSTEGFKINRCKFAGEGGRAGRRPAKINQRLCSRSLSQLLFWLVKSLEGKVPADLNKRYRRTAASRAESRRHVE
jgi:hypothetical protein